MSFDKKQEPDPALQAQLAQLQEERDEKKAKMKEVEANAKMAEALAPALQALAQATQEQQLGGQIGGQNPYALASGQLPCQVPAGSHVALNSSMGSAVSARPVIAVVGGGGYNKV